MKDSMVLSWQPPTSTGSSDISAYIIEKRDAKRNTWSPVDKVTGTTLTYAVQKLLEGNQYYFRVSAENDIGTSEPVELKEPVLAKCPYGRWFYVCHICPKYWDTLTFTTVLANTADGKLAIFFPRKLDLIFHANFLHWRQFA